MAITLDANDPNQVASASHLEIDIGQANKKALVFSGIAIPSWNLNDDSNIYRQTITVNLRYQVLAVEQATVSVGLGSIYNDDSPFVYATDTAELCVDNNSQELLLQVGAALMGDPAALNRFGYQVVAIVTTQVTGISGTIRFGKDVFDASGLTENQILQLFLVSAGTQTELPPPPGGGFGQIVYNPLAYGQITGMTVSGNDFNVTYNIPGAPYNQNLVVQVQNGPLFITTHQTSTNQTAGPSPILLTVANPSVSGVDFRITNVIVK